MSISVNQLTKKFGDQVAVDHISFRIEKGITGFLGPNGAGKSTTMKMITGYLKADGGEIMLNGMRMHVQNREAKKKIGYLPESNPLYYDMYVREYLKFIAGIHHIKQSNAAVEKVIAITGLTPESGKKVGQLSKGYKQRVGLAAALVHDPEILILDEPTSGLDPNQIVEIRSVIRELAAEKTILFSTHIMQEVEQLCDRAIIINKGKIVADDNLETLRKKGSRKSFIIVEFSSQPGDGKLNALRHVDFMTALPGKATAWKLETGKPDDLRRELMQLSLQEGIQILSLQNESSSLESVFQSLTLHTVNK